MLAETELHRPAVFAGQPLRAMSFIPPLSSDYKTHVHFGRSCADGVTLPIAAVRYWELAKEQYPILRESL
ncbi:MAG: hypothetical protein AAF355_11460 [Myxococcota bacterium]